MGQDEVSARPSVFDEPDFPIDVRRAAMASGGRVDDALDASQMHAEPNHRLGGGTHDRREHAWPEDSPAFLKSGAVMVVLLVTNY